MSIERKFSVGVAWMAAGSWIEQAFNFLIFVILARLLGAEALGLAAMAVSFIVLGAALVRETFTEHLIAHDDPQEADYNAVFWSLVGLAVLLAALIYFLSDPIAAFYGEPEVAEFLRALSPVVLMISIGAVPVAILRREMRFNVLSLRAITGVVVGGVVGIAMAVSGFGVWSLIIQHLVLIAVNAVMAWFAVDWRPGRIPSLEYFRAVWRFGSKVVGLRMAELVSVQGPMVMIGATLGATALGQFSVAWRLIEIGSFLVVTPLRMTSQSAFAALKRSTGSARELLSDLFDVISLLALPAFVGLAILAPEVITTVFGQGRWEDAIPALRVLSLAGIFFCFEKVQQSFCLAYGKPGQVTFVSWIEALLGMVLVWIAAPFGIAYVALVFVARFYLLWPWRFWIVQRLDGPTMLDFIRTAWQPSIAVIVMGAAVLGITFLVENFILTIILGSVIGAVIFGLAVKLFMAGRIKTALKLSGRDMPL